jgi:hypothetical protein
VVNNSEEGKDFEEQNVLRVDNGWNFDPKSNALPLNSRPDNWNEVLDDVLEADYVKRELSHKKPPTISFKRLYRKIYCRGKDENWSNWDLTEYKFNLWLRHASESKYLFRYVIWITAISSKFEALLTFLHYSIDREYTVSVLVKSLWGGVDVPDDAMASRNSTTWEMFLGD